MSYFHFKKITPRILFSLFVFILISGSIIYTLLRLITLEKKFALLSSEVATTNKTLLTNTQELSKNVTDLSTQTKGLSTTITHAQKNIDDVKSQVGGVEQTVGTISGTVGTLQKLALTDPELLKKYSKVYFMNENYVPAHLTIIPQVYTYNEKRQEQFLSESWPYLKALLDDAQANTITLFVKSGYRSFSEQKSLKSSYSVIYGAGTANSFSADQGYSEHQLGTTIDFITTGTGGQLAGFDETQAYQWLTMNAYKYGFILSYPKANGYYIYEPWHWRYVGVKLATYLHDTKLNFYTMDQRDIDTYLVNIFD